MGESESEEKDTLGGLSYPKMGSGGLSEFFIALSPAYDGQIKVLLKGPLFLWLRRICLATDPDLAPRGQWTDVGTRSTGTEEQQQQFRTLFPKEVEVWGKATVSNGDKVHAADSIDEDLPTKHR